MSECVVRMEMPKSCDLCPCLDENGDYPRCMITSEQRGYTFNIREKRMPDCPIICALPKNHGRLVDMRDIDSMMEDVQTTSDESGLYGLYYRDDIDFDGLPTIVPAERGRTMELIDRDAVESIIKKWFEVMHVNPDILLDGVKSLSTIVPAERSDMKPCPFCGNTRPHIVTIDDPTGYYDGEMRGTWCGAVICYCGAIMKGSDENDAVQRWNRRANDGID